MTRKEVGCRSYSTRRKSRLLHCAPSLTQKTALSVAYACGLRVSEIVHVKVGNITSIPAAC
ncbi:MAG: hypothetical protein JO303_07410 [Caulobacteraceae bacterium]|nr:hypothetical protein [Caulobacteraceae bacterium]